MLIACLLLACCVPIAYSLLPIARCLLPVAYIPGLSLSLSPSPIAGRTYGNLGSTREPGIASRVEHSYILLNPCSCQIAHHAFGPHANLHSKGARVLI